MPRTRRGLVNDSPAHLSTVAGSSGAYDRLRRAGDGWGRTRRFQMTSCGDGRLRIGLNWTDSTGMDGWWRPTRRRLRCTTLTAIYSSSRNTPGGSFTARYYELSAETGRDKATTVCFYRSLSQRRAGVSQMMTGAATVAGAVN